MGPLLFDAHPSADRCGECFQQRALNHEPRHANARESSNSRDILSTTAFIPLPAMTPDQRDVEQALQSLLTAVAGPSYARALQQGELPQQLERCMEWVKAEASEASSLIESCVPHGKPMLAQAQKRLEALEAIQTLDRLRAACFDSPS